MPPANIIIKYLFYKIKLLFVFCIKRLNYFYIGDKIIKRGEAMLSDDIKMIMAKRNISKAELARKIGESPQNLYLKFKRNSFQDDDFAKILNEIGVKAEITYIDKENDAEIYRRTL